MPELITTPVVETKTVNQVQITGFEMNYEEMKMTSSYMTLLEDDTPYQRGQVEITDPTEITAIYTEIETSIRAGKTFDEASAIVAYAKVLANLG